MAKTSISTAVPGQISELQKQAIVDLPTQQEQAPADSFEALMAEPTDVPAADITSAVGEGVEAGLATEAEIQRQAVPSMAARAADTTRVDKWLESPKTSDISQQPDGNIRSRAAAMAKANREGKLMLGVSPRNTPAFPVIAQGGTQQEAAAAVAEEKEGSLIAAVHRAGAVEQDPDTGKFRLNDLYMQIGSAVTENMIMDSAAGAAEQTLDPIAQALNEQRTVPEGETKKPQPVSKSQGNAALGQQIHQEYQRMQGVKQPDKLPQAEAETLGDAFKETWAAQNPDLVNTYTDPATNQRYYQLTSLGEAALEGGAYERKRLFPKQNVRPAKTPPPKGRLQGDVGANVAKRVSGRVGDQKFSGVIEQAMVNMSQVPNVVDKQRAKILFMTALPALKTGDHTTWQADINNFGPRALRKFEAARVDNMRRREAGANVEPYDVDGTMQMLVSKIAQEIRSVAMERNGANYLTYNVQGFNGRITPQQTYFNPTTSKAVRFVTRNAIPAKATPGSRIERNLRQMYAMMLVKGADTQLPNEREAMLEAATPKLIAWGNMLAEAITMSDAQYEQIAEAIEAGQPLTNIDIPTLEVSDPELQKAIQSKGEDGPHFIDGLIDFAKYAEARKMGKPYFSYFNAYIDGKTNGLASNGIQMGHDVTAQRTGVWRHNNKSLLDDGDIRDELAKISTESIRDGWDGNVSGFESELNDVAKAVFNYRDLNKKTTMTFGYGKEIDSFLTDIQESLSFLAEEAKTDPDSTYNESLAVLQENMADADIAETLLNKYEPALRQVLSDDAINSRQLMRGAAMLHAATNSLFAIKSYTGMDLHLGRDLTTGYDDASKTSYRIYGADNEQRTAAHYQTEATAAAPRNMVDKATGEMQAVPGEYAYGGSLPGPVQSLDAATVAMSASGKSWQRLRDNSQENPYMHTIYDAFKLDAMGYDVAMEEINNNWLKASMDWSYLEETQKATRETFIEWNKKMATRDPNEKLTANEAVYMNWMLEISESQSGEKIMKNWLKKMNRVKDFENDKVMWGQHKHFVNEMRNVGYDVHNPPAEPTVRQLKTFVRLLTDELNLNNRLSSMISKTNKNKKRLAERIRRSGPVLQYYAH